MPDKAEEERPLLGEKTDVEAPGAAAPAPKSGPSLAAKLLNEYIGTFFLVLTVSLSVAQTTDGKDLPNVGLAIGTMLAVMIYQGGHISGAHFNPAVTLGVLLSGRKLITIKESALYVASQVFAGLCAAWLGYFLTGNDWGPDVGAEAGLGRGLVAEIIFTMVLVSIVLNVATAKSTENNHFYGYAIGLLVFVGATSVGGISGAVFNPAVGTGIGSVDLAFSGKSPMWLYWAGPCVGSVFASGLFRLMQAGEYAK